MLFGTKQVLGVYAILVQALPFAVLHYAKPFPVGGDGRVLDVLIPESVPVINRPTPDVLPALNRAAIEYVLMPSIHR